MSLYKDILLDIMDILGIGGSQHDYAFCILRDGKVCVAIEEERVSREKHGNGLRSQALSGISYCLASQDMTIDDIDCVVSNNLWGISAYTRYPFFSKVFRINHHMAHACAAFYNSGFEESAILVIDGAGDHYRDNMSETISLGTATQKGPCFYEKILGEEREYDDFFGLLHTFNIKKAFSPQLIDKDRLDSLFLTDNSLGDFYSLMSYCCGFILLSEGKTMGLASYGTDRYVKELRSLVKYSYDEHKNCNISIKIDEVYQFLRELVKKDDDFDKKADLAYAAQRILEETIFFLMNCLYDKSHSKNLCYSGGVALNSVLNGKIKKYTPFENVYIYPAAGDSGTAIGSAMYAYHVMFGNTYIPKTSNTCYYGISYENKEIEKAIRRYSNQVVGIRLNDKECIENAAQMLSEGKVIGWFQGRSEFGPRALGNRSILADPRRSEMKDIINKKVKFRESFRPFAPVVTYEDVHDYFDTDFEDNPYMLYVANVKENQRARLAAVTHVDGTARLQTIKRSQNPKYYDLIKEFQRYSDIPVLLNTSFNIKGRPIVEKPEDAIECLLGSSIDAIFIENWYLVKRNTND